MKKRPNILFALADDASHFGLYGHDFVRTPHIDTLGRDGIVFENAFTPNPKCAPSRASILTGRFPWQNEEACNHFGLFPAGFPLLPDLLEDSGYSVGYTGKGWGPGDYQRNGLKRNPAGNCFNRCRLSPPEGSAIRDCDYAENFRDFLDQAEPGKPFYFWYGCFEPHRPYTFGEGQGHGVRNSDIKEIPSYWPDTETVRTDLLDYAYEISWFDLHLGKMLDLLKERGLYEDTLIVVTSDNGCPFPRVKGQMYEQDFHLPLVACWGDRRVAGTRVRDLINFPDIMPTFLSLADVPIPDSVCGRSFADALLSPCGGQVDPERSVTFFGREKHDLGREGDLGYPVRCIREEHYLYVHNFAPERWPAGNPETGFTNCDGSPTKNEILALHDAGEDRLFLLSFGKRPREELYDIVQDPERIRNLAPLPEFDTLRRSMKDRLFDFLRRTQDPRLADPDYFERFPYVGNDKHSWRALTEGRFVRQDF